VISVAGIAIAGILGYVIAHRTPQTVTKTTIVTVTQPAATKTVTTAAPARRVTAAAPVAAPAPRVRVNLTATQETWLEARRGSKTGAVLFSGNLAEGQSLHLTGTRVFVRFAAAGNVHIVANGKLVTLMGTYDKLFVPSPR
jgi:hypothetical protein